MFSEFNRIYHLLILLVLTLVIASVFLVSCFNQEEQLGCGVVGNRGYCGTRSYTSNNKAGAILFANDCASCHAMDEVLVGPALGGISSRRDKKWISAFIRNPMKLIKKKDKQALEVYNLFSQQLMPSFKLTDAEVDSIIDYLQPQAEY